MSEKMLHNFKEKSSLFWRKLQNFEKISVYSHYFIIYLMFNIQCASEVNAFKNAVYSDVEIAFYVTD